MNQYTLFDSGPRILFDDAKGRVDYTPDLVPADVARRWFAYLRDRVAWHSERRLMYEREVDVPRLTAQFRLDDPALPTTLTEAAAAVRASVDAPFDSVGLNFYRDEHDSVAPHNDKLHRMVADQPIALLSLGAARHMTIRAKQAPRRVLHIDLEPGSHAAHGLHEPAALRPRHPEAARPGRAAHQPRVPRARTSRGMNGGGMSPLLAAALGGCVAAAASGPPPA